MSDRIAPLPGRLASLLSSSFSSSSEFSFSEFSSELSESFSFGPPLCPSPLLLPLLFCALGFDL
jgi:hypothetical protein